MRISSQRKTGQMFECLQPASGIKLTGPGVATKHLRKLDIEEMGCVKDFIGIENSFGQLSSGGRFLLPVVSRLRVQRSVEHPWHSLEALA